MLARAHERREALKVKLKEATRTSPVKRHVDSSEEAENRPPEIPSCNNCEGY
jgi:hypothetical protein